MIRTESFDAMSERAGDSAATVKAGETANRPAEEAPAAPPMEGDFEAPDNIADIDNALADVAEDLARLEQANAEPARETRSFRADSSLNDTLGTVSRDLDPEQDTVTADSVEDLDNQLSGMDDSSDGGTDEGVDDAIGQIFDSRASAVRRKAVAPTPPATPKTLPPDPKRDLEFEAPQPKAAPAAPECEAEDEVEIEIEEVAEPAGSFQAPDDILPTPSTGAAASAVEAPPAPAGFTVPERRPEEDEASSSSVEEFEIEVEEMDAAEAAPPPAKAPSVAAKPAPAKPAPESKAVPDAKAAPEPPKADALARAAEAAAASREAAKAPTAKSSKLGAILTPLIMLLVVLNKPFGKMSRSTRDTLGLLGAGTLFNALCAWVYWLLLR